MGVQLDSAIVSDNNQHDSSARIKPLGCSQEEDETD